MTSARASVMEGLDDVRPGLEDLYRDLHAHPELAFEEHRTAADSGGTFERDIPSNHSPHFAPLLQPTLDGGVTALVTAALAWLGPGSAAS